MKQLLAFLAIATVGLSVGCGPEIAAPPTEEEVEAVQAPVDDYMEQMQNMKSTNTKEAPEMGVKPTTE